MSTSQTKIDGGAPSALIAPSGSELENARNVLARIVELMGMSANVEGRVVDEQIWLTVSGEDVGQLIGKKGQTLDALQSLVGRIASREVGRGLALTVDAESYRERRAASLRQMAERLKDQVLESGHTVALNPMSARDRRVIHLTLRDEAGVSTRSEGQGDERRILIVPE